MGTERPESRAVPKGTRPRQTVETEHGPEGRRHREPWAAAPRREGQRGKEDHPAGNRKTLSPAKGRAARAENPLGKARGESLDEEVETAGRVRAGGTETTGRRQVPDPRRKEGGGSSPRGRPHMAVSQPKPKVCEKHKGHAGPGNRSKAEHRKTPVGTERVRPDEGEAGTREGNRKCGEAGLGT